MKTFAPGYYKKFKCIASACRHSCCIGWEIDIDDDTADCYLSLNDKELKENIDFSKGDSAHFILKENGRCPFLDENNLCKIITKYGENALCDICFEHPRFYNMRLGNEEAGLGLCCEEAARIILENDEEFNLVEIEDDGAEVIENSEKFVNDIRLDIFKIIENKSFSVSEIFDKLGALTSSGFFDFSPEEAEKILRSTERLDKNWDEKLDLLKISSFSPNNITDENIKQAIRNLLTYFVYRHCPADKSNPDFEKKMYFALFSSAVIILIFLSSNDKSLENFEDIARMYSSEIEYLES